MPPSEPALTIGIEEEYHLVDVTTRALVAEAPPDFIAECEQVARAAGLDGVPPLPDRDRHPTLPHAR